MDSETTPSSSNNDVPWTHALNKGLIAVGVVAFGLIVTDRFLDAYSIEKMPVDSANKPVSGNNAVDMAGSGNTGAVSADGVAALDPKPLALDANDSGSLASLQKPALSAAEPPASVENVAPGSAAADAMSTLGEGVSIAAGEWESAKQLVVAGGEVLSDGGAVVPLTGGHATESVKSAIPVDQGDPLVELQNLFGSRVVFVSASAPVYVVTEDERQFALGSLIDDQTSLTAVTSDQLVVERGGDLTIFSLPDPITR